MIVFLFCILISHSLSAKIQRNESAQTHFDREKVATYRGRIAAIVDYSTEGEEVILDKIAVIASESERKGLFKKNGDFLNEVRRVYLWYQLLAEHTAAARKAKVQEKDERFYGKRLTRAIKRAYYFFVEQFTRADNTRKLMDALFLDARRELKEDSVQFKELYEKLRSIASNSQPWKNEDFDFFVQQHAFFTMLYKLVTEQLVKYKLEKKAPTGEELVAAFLPLIEKARAASNNLFEKVVFRAAVNEKDSYAVIEAEKIGEKPALPKQVFPRTVSPVIPATYPAQKETVLSVQPQSPQTKDDEVAGALDTADDDDDVLSAYASGKGGSIVGSGWSSAAKVAGMVAAGVGAASVASNLLKKRAKPVKRRDNVFQDETLSALRVADLPQPPAGISPELAKSHASFAQAYQRLQQELDAEVGLLARNKQEAARLLTNLPRT